jgi:hypothetical protein
MQDDDDNSEGRIKIEFATGCFDGFSGTAEELEELIDMVVRKVTDGSLFAQSMSLEELAQHDPALAQQLMSAAPDLVHSSTGDEKLLERLRMLSPETVQFVEQFVESLSDAQVSEMLQAIEIMGQYPEVSNSLH